MRKSEDLASDLRDPDRVPDSGEDTPEHVMTPVRDTCQWVGVISGTNNEQRVENDWQRDLWVIGMDFD